jgi:endo-1,4-beta-xylanase
MTRRQAIQALAGLGAATLSRWAGAQSAPVTLRAAAAARGLLVGCAVADAPLRTDAAYRDLVRAQANIVVAENAFKFGLLRPTPNTFDFDRADELAAFAKANSMRLRGHNFVWHRQLPGWFASYVTAQNAERVLVEHIERVGGRYAGQIHSWDVVNEAVELADKLPGGLRNSPWQQLLPGYIDIAYRTARRVDPHALLVYNDYGIEGEDPASAAKRAAVLALLRGLQNRNVPIDALGIQSHLSAADPSGHPPTYGPGLMELIAQVRSMGLKVLITELDVNDRHLPAAIPERDAAVAAVYASYLETVLADPAVIAVLTWGITDRYTWLNGEDSRPDHQPERPLPFDAAMQPTPAFAAMLHALQGKPHEIRPMELSGLRLRTDTQTTAPSVG